MRNLVNGFLLAAVLIAQATIAVPAQVSQSGLPVPTGQYKVGRTEFDWTDQSRKEPADKGSHREIVVWVWYPASPQSTAEPAEWMPGKWGELLWQDFERRYPVFHQIAKQSPPKSIRTHAFADAPFASAEQPFPL